MMKGGSPKGAPERSSKAGEGAPSGVDGNGPKRFSVQRKRCVRSVSTPAEFSKVKTKRFAGSAIG
jgi:hypothetical protein